MEVTLNNGLTGEEIRIAVLDKIATSLQRDCYLAKNFTYRGCTVEVTIKIKADDVGGEKVVERTIAHVAGEPVSDEPDMDIVAEVGIENEPPNQTRIETGQPIPVQSVTAEGKKVEKHVPYARPKKAVAAR